MYLIETERLGLRNLTPDDLEFLYPILSDRETMQYYPKPYSRQMTESWINRAIKSYQDNGFGLWAVIYKEKDQFIGQGGISLQNIDGDPVPEIGYQLNKSFWNQGLATELAKQCLTFGFGKLKLDKIFIHTWIKNIPSCRVAEKTGMLKQKEYEKIVDPAGNTMRHVVYALNKSEFSSP